MPICIFLCRAAYWWFLKDWLHWSHLKHLLSSWVFSWVLKLELCEKDLPHLSHEKGLCPVCILSRASKWYLFENDLLHFEQESGFSPLWALWTFVWEAKEEPCANDIRHVWHEKGFSPECTLSWLLNLLFSPNVFWHLSQENLFVCSFMSTLGKIFVTFAAGKRLFVREGFNEKKTFSFGHCPN